MKPYINITGKKSGYTISSNHPMFKNEYLKCKFIDNSIEISVPDIDYNGKMYKISAIKYDWYNFGFTCQDLKSGKLFLDEEESDEDLLIFKYYE